MTTNLKENMRIWKEVRVTDPAHTKGVTRGRKFTAIDAMYQVQRATEIFGPVGIGWGYDVTYEILGSTAGGELPTPLVPFVVASVTLWHGNRDNTFGPIMAIHPLVAKYSSGAQFDDDAPKKALTDALTKALSHLGFSADVFLGKYDDNKYVEKAREYTERERTRKLSEYRKEEKNEGSE